jgi:hypothetical protein
LRRIKTFPENSIMFRSFICTFVVSLLPSLFLSYHWYVYNKTVLFRFHLRCFMFILSYSSIVSFPLSLFHLYFCGFICYFFVLFLFLLFHLYLWFRFYLCCFVYNFIISITVVYRQNEEKFSSALRPHLQRINRYILHPIYLFFSALFLYIFSIAECRL